MESLKYAKKYVDGCRDISIDVNSAGELILAYHVEKLVTVMEKIANLLEKNSVSCATEIEPVIGKKSKK